MHAGLSNYLSMFLSIYLSIHLSVCASVHLSIYPSLSLSLSLSLSVYLPTFASFSPFIFVSAYPSNLSFDHGSASWALSYFGQLYVGLLVP